MAQDGGEIMPEQEPGIIERSLQVAKDNPVPTGIAAFLALDYLEGDGIDLSGSWAETVTCLQQSYMCLDRATA